MITPRRSTIAYRSPLRGSPIRRSVTSGLITRAKLRRSGNVDRFLNKMYKTVSKSVGSTEKVKEGQIVRECSTEEVRECNLVNNHVCNGIYGDEVPSMQCNDVYKLKVEMNLVKYTRMFPRWCGRMFQR